MPPSNLTQNQHNHLKKILILGAESTGKTTLCQDLATHLNCQWVPEYMREYLQKKWDIEQKTCEWHDLLPIAQGQIDSENQKANQTQNYLFCDTALIELMVYSYWYYQDCPTQIEQAVQTHHYDLILLTEVDVEWVADDLRDCPFQRQDITEQFIKTLNHLEKPFKRIGGNRATRVKKVMSWLVEMDR